MHKITNNFIKSRGSNLMLNKSGRGQPKKHPHQICNKSVQWFNRKNSTMGYYRVTDSNIL